MRRTRFALVVLILVLLSTSFGFGTDDDKKMENKEFQQLLHDWKNALYNGDYGKTAEFYYACKKLEHDDPICEWRHANDIFSELRTKQKKDELKLERLEYDELMIVFDTGLKKAEVKIEAGIDPDFNRYIQCSLHGFRGLFEKSNNAKWAALDSAHKMREICGETRYQDAKYLPGLLEYETSKQAWLTRRLAGLPPFSLPTDKRDGLRAIVDSVRGNENPFVDDIWFVIFRILTDTQVDAKSRAEAAEVLKISADEVSARLLPKYSHNLALLRYATHTHAK